MQLAIDYGFEPARHLTTKPGASSGNRAAAQEQRQCLCDRWFRIRLSNGAQTIFVEGSGREIQLGDRTLLVGVLNVTPDSFSDGGKYLDPDGACAHALAMEEQGADLIDVGAESDAAQLEADHRGRRTGRAWRPS